MSAQVTPHAAAMTLPAAGLGAVASGRSTPTKKSAAPAPSNAITGRSVRRSGSRSSNGPSNRTQRGAVVCRKIAFAAVVRVLAVTKRIMVAANATPTRSARGSKPRHAGISAANTVAAIPERSPAICQLDSKDSLIAVPPVEKSRAARAT